MKKLKEFEILRKIGSGGFGQVYSVRRKVDQTLYVLKSVDLSGPDSQEALREAHLLAALDSPHIVRYYEAFIEDKTLHIITEHCERGDLQEYLARYMGRLLPESIVWKIFTHVAKGVQYLHSRKVIHRDLKPRNVFLTGSGAKIGDLGTARVLNSASATDTVGTLHYLSPELVNQQPYDSKSDIWGLGCLLYELVTLKKPFDGLSQGQLLAKIATGEYVAVSTEYSPQLRHLVGLCLNKDPVGRPSIEEIVGICDRRCVLSPNNF